MELNAEALAQYMSKAAVSIHRESGELAPTLAFFHEEDGLQAQVMISGPASENMPETVFMVGIVLCSALNPQPTWIALNTEAWSRPAEDGVNTVEDADARMPKGHLEKLAGEGDPLVHTVLMSHVWAVTGGSLNGVIVDVDNGYEIKDLEHTMEGAIPGAFAHLSESLPGARARCPEDYDIRHALEFLEPFITVAIIPDDGGPGVRMTDDAG